MADVTGDTPHSGGALEVGPLGRDAETFRAGLDAMPQFSVEETSVEEVGGMTGPAGIVTWSGEDWSHIDVPRTENPGPSVDFLYPSWVFVTDLRDRIVMVQVWANTRDELEAWLPDARRILDSLKSAEAP